jgi:hypothetical protein
MTTLKRPIALALTTFGVSLVGSAVAGQPVEARTACHKPKGATTVISGTRGIVFRKLVQGPDGDRSEDRQRYWGCLKPHGRLRRLYDTRPRGSYETITAAQFRLAGGFVASVVTSTNHYGGFHRTVIESDLSGRLGRRQTTVGAGQLEGAHGPARQMDILRLRLSTSGAVAWLQRDTDVQANPRDRLLTFAGGVAGSLGQTEMKQLAIAPVGQIGKISLRGLQLSWVREGVPDSVILQAAW